MTVRLLIGDCRQRLAEIPAGSVHTCVTSPPYFGLRSYDEDAVMIDPGLSADERAWLEAELLRRGIRARS